MRLFKVILVLFAIYFIRRFWQLYRAMEKRGKELAAEEQKKSEASPVEDKKTVNADFKVID